MHSGTYPEKAVLLRPEGKERRPSRAAPHWALCVIVAQLVSVMPSLASRERKSGRRQPAYGFEKLTTAKVSAMLHFCGSSQPLTWSHMLSFPAGLLQRGSSSPAK